MYAEREPAIGLSASGAKGIITPGLIDGRNCERRMGQFSYVPYRKMPKAIKWNDGELNSLLYFKRFSFAEERRNIAVFLSILSPGSRGLE